MALVGQTVKDGLARNIDGTPEVNRCMNNLEEEVNSLINIMSGFTSRLDWVIIPSASNQHDLLNSHPSNPEEVKAPLCYHIDSIAMTVRTERVRIEQLAERLAL